MSTTSGSAKWQGGIKDGKGAISTKSGALSDYPYGFAARFEEMQELLAQIMLLNSETSDRSVDPDADALRLTDVPGIGPAKLDAMRPMVTV